jgi:hypothetical protein
MLPLMKLEDSLGSQLILAIHDIVLLSIKSKHLISNSSTLRYQSLRASGIAFFTHSIQFEIAFLGASLMKFLVLSINHFFTSSSAFFDQVTNFSTLSLIQRAFGNFL